MSWAILEHLDVCHHATLISTIEPKREVAVVKMNIHLKVNTKFLFAKLIKFY